MRKILYIAQTRFPTEKAQGLQTAKVCEALGRAGFSVELLIPRRENMIKEDAFTFYSLERLFEVIRLRSLSSSLSSFGFFIESVSFLLSAKIYSHKKKPYIIYTTDLFVPFVFPCSVLEAHDMPQTHIWFYRFAWRKIHLIVAKTNVIKNELMEKFGVPENKIIVLPNGIDLKIFDTGLSKEEAREKIGLPQGATIALYSGSFAYKWKGTDTFLQAAAIAKDISFFLVGGLEADIKRATASFQDLNIFFVVRKPHKDVPIYLAAADVLVLPDKKGDKVSEGYTSPMKLFEYMASKRPIVASDLGSIKEVVGDQEVFFFTPNDPASLAKTILYVVTHKDESVTRARRAYEVVKVMSWDNYVKKLFPFLRE